jgi:hypothetical protein
MPRQSGRFADGGWFVLGDLRFHGKAEGREPEESALEQFGAGSIVETDVRDVAVVRWSCRSDVKVRPYLAGGKPEAPSGVY